MARLGQIEPPKVPRAPQVVEPAEIVAHQARVEELRQLVQRRAYTIDPRRLALRILARALRHR